MRMSWVSIFGVTIWHHATHFIPLFEYVRNEYLNMDWDHITNFAHSLFWMTILTHQLTSRHLFYRTESIFRTNVSTPIDITILILYSVCSEWLPISAPIWHHTTLCAHLDPTSQGIIQPLPPASSIELNTWQKMIIIQCCLALRTWLVKMPLCIR